MPVPGDFQLTSEQKGILKQALHYKRAWENDEKTAFDTAFKTTLENANRDVARIILQTQEQQGVLPSLTPTSSTNQRNGVAVSTSQQPSRQYVTGSSNKKKSTSGTNSRGGDGGGLSPVPSVVVAASSAQNNIPPHQRPRYNNNTLNNPLFPLQQLPDLETSNGRRGRGGGMGGGSVVSGSSRTEASHHAVSSVLCRDASDVSAASTRVRDLEARLKNEEAKRIQVHNELQEIRALIESQLAGGGVVPPGNNNKRARVSTNGLDASGSNYRRGTPATKQVSLRALSNGRHTVDLRSKAKTGKGVVDPAPYAYRLQ